MLLVEIKGKEYELLEGWNEMLLGKFLEVYTFLKENDIDIFESKCKLLSVLMDCELDTIEDLSLDEIGELCTSIGWLNEKPNTDYKEVIEIVNDHNEVIKYVFRKNRSLSGREQITMEYLLKDASDNTLVYPVILAVLLRMGIEKKNAETGEIYYEQVELDKDMDSILKRADMFKKKLYISDVYGGLVFFSSGEKNSSMKTMEPSSSLKIRKKVNS